MEKWCPEQISSSLRLGSVGVCVGVCVCMCFKVSSMTPITSAPLGSFFPLFPQLSPGSLPRYPHTPAYAQGLLGDAPPPRPAAVKTLRAHLLTLPCSLSCVTPVAPASTFLISLYLCVFLPTGSGLREGRGLSDPA